MLRTCFLGKNNDVKELTPDKRVQTTSKTVSVLKGTSIFNVESLKSLLNKLELNLVNKNERRRKKV